MRLAASSEDVVAATMGLGYTSENKLASTCYVGAGGLAELLCQLER